MYSSVSARMNLTDIVQWVHLTSFSKDTIHLEWGVDHETQSIVTGYRIRYQVEKSKVVQFSPVLSRWAKRYGISKLHEDTNYDVCVQVLANNTHESIVDKCLRASTTTDSLTVALGSTFGAFLALGIIVMFVFLAKWQHQRKQRKLQLQQSTPSDGSYDSMAQGDGEYEMSDVSLQVHEDKLTTEFSDQSSPGQSMTANGSLHHHLPPDIDEDEEYMEDYDPEEIDMLEGSVTVHEPPDSGQCSPMTPELLEYDEVSSPNGVPISMGGETPSPLEAALLDPFAESSYPQNPPDGRPPDVRPKDKALLDLTHMYANKKLFEQPQTQLRPNMSCNW